MSLKVSESMVTYQSTDDSNVLTLIDTVRNGLEYSFFSDFNERAPFTMQEWSEFLHLSPRTMQRYKKENKPFDPIYSDRILEIMMLYKLGVDVFGDEDKFHSWLDSNNIALGGVLPRSLMDNAFGIKLVKDELTRIEHGVLA